MTPRTLLKCLWPVLRRGGGEVQLGVEPSRSVVIQGLDEAQIRALESLDGTRAVPSVLRSDPTLLHGLRTRGLVAPVEDDHDIPVELRVALATDAEALVRAGTTSGGYAALARRRSATVLIAGHGELPLALATLLRRASVGRVRVGPSALDDLEHAVSAAGAESIAGAVSVARAEHPDVALVVLVGAQALAPGLGEPWRRRGVPVLPVVMHLVESVVGPVLAAPGPCLRCLDLTRADLDSAWPLLAGQLTRGAVGDGPEIGGETTLVALTAALAAMVALAVVDRRPLPPGRSLEVAMPWPGVRQRRWSAHPRCTCSSVGLRRGVLHQPADGRGPAPATMER